METLQKERAFETHSLQYEYNEALRRKNDTTTWLAEVLDGSMQTSFNYWFDGHDIRAEDNSSMRSVFEASLADAELLASIQPELSFELRRRKAEWQEYQDMLAMLRGELPNTMIVVSDFPDELRHATEDVGGYNVKRRQTMLRVVTKNGDGSLTMRSQSLDRSDRQALENIYFELGFAPSEGELLNQRMHVQLDDAHAQDSLTEHLVGVYDQTLERRYGQEFYCGRTSSDRINTADFVASQADLIATYIHHPQYGSPNLQRQIAALMTERFEGKSSLYTGEQYSVNEVEAGMVGAGKRADDEGKVFSGCGVTSGAKSQLEELGLGNKACIEIKNGQKVKCPGCNETVKAIVSASKDSIHCSNASCKLAHPSIKHAKRRKKVKPKSHTRASRKKVNSKEHQHHEQKRPAKA